MKNMLEMAALLKTEVWALIDLDFARTAKNRVICWSQVQEQTYLKNQYLSSLNQLLTKHTDFFISCDHTLSDKLSH